MSWKEPRKNTRILKYSLTLFDLIVNNEYNFIKFAKNEDLISDLVKCIGEFPIYKHWIQSNIDMRTEDCRIFDEAGKILSSILPILQPTKKIITDILDELSKAYWKKLLD